MIHLKGPIILTWLVIRYSMNILDLFKPIDLFEN